MNATTKLLFLTSMTWMMWSCTSNPPTKPSTDAITNPVTAEQPEANLSGAADIAFEKSEHDFGKITQGEKAEYSFKFTNTGKGQLLLSNATASCGCTVPSYSKEPIMPGKSGFIKVTFDSDKRLDRFEKTITVTSNTIPADHVLYIRGMVIPRPEDQYKILHNLD